MEPMYKFSMKLKGTAGFDTRVMSLNPIRQTAYTRFD